MIFCQHCLKEMRSSKFVTEIEICIENVCYIDCNNRLFLYQQNDNAL